MPLTERLKIDFAFADPETLQPMGATHQTEESTGDWHQFLAHGQGVIKNGQAALIVGNPTPLTSRVAVYFDQDQWLELLYNIGTFEENYAKTLLIIWARLAMLSAVGLFFSVFTSFPVACFCVLTFYTICVGMPFWLEAVGAELEVRTDDLDPYGRFGPAVRLFLVPIMRFAFPNFGEYNGARLLIDGKYIPGLLLLRSLAHTLVYGTLLLVLPGWLIFRRREVAEVTA
jgi:hypothetical protein